MSNLAYDDLGSGDPVVFIAGIFFLTQVQHSAMERKTHYA